MQALTITEDWASIIPVKIWVQRADQLTHQVSTHLMQLVCHQSNSVESLHIAQVLTMILTTEKKATEMTLKDSCITSINMAQISIATIKTQDLSTNNSKTLTEDKIIDQKRTKASTVPTINSQSKNVTSIRATEDLIKDACSPTVAVSYKLIATLKLSSTCSTILVVGTNLSRST